MLDILCHECGTQMRLPDDWAGKKGKCPNCGCVLLIGPAEPAPPPGADKADVPVSGGAPLPVLRAVAPAPQKTGMAQAGEQPTQAAPVAIPPRSAGPRAAKPQGAGPLPAQAALPGGLPPPLPKAVPGAPHLDLRKRIKKRPSLWLIGATGVGLLLLIALMALTRREPSPRPAADNRVADASGNRVGLPTPPAEATTRVRPPAEPEPQPPADKHAKKPRTPQPKPAKLPDVEPLQPPASETPVARNTSRDPLPSRGGDGMKGVSRQYDDLQCRQIQGRHGIRIPAAATIIDVNGLRLPITRPASLAAAPAPFLFLPRGAHAVCFRPSELPVPVTVESDLAVEYDGMRQFFDVGGSVRGQELMSRNARTLDVHGAPFLLNFSGAEYAARNEWDVAERKFRRALCVNPAFAPAHLNLAECLLRRNARDPAAREVQLAEAFNAGNVFALAGAVHQLRQKLKMPAEGGEPVDVSAISYVSAESLTEDDVRITALLEGISKYAVRDEERAKILNNLAVHFADSGRPELALHYFHDALEVVMRAGPERYNLTRRIFGTMSDVCQKAGFKEAEEYRKMQSMVSP